MMTEVLKSIREPTRAILVAAETHLFDSSYPFGDSVLPLQIKGDYIEEQFYKSGDRSIVKILDDAGVLKFKGVGHMKKATHMPEIYYDGRYIHACSPTSKGVDGFLKEAQAKNEIFWINELNGTEIVNYRTLKGAAS